MRGKGGGGEGVEGGGVPEEQRGTFLGVGAKVRKGGGVQGGEVWGEVKQGGVGAEMSSSRALLKGGGQGDGGEGLGKGAGRGGDRNQFLLKNKG